MAILGDIPIIEVGDTKIQYNGKKERKIKDDKIKPIISFTHNILNIPVNSEDKDGFDKKVK